MNRRQFLRHVALGCAALGTPGWMGCATSATPNFIFILVDDLGWADLGCYGSSFYETPHLDKLAASGLRFTNAYAACPVCSPTRAAIMTGQHPVRLGITDWIPGQDPQDRKLLGPADKHELALAETTIAEVLQEHGYSTFFAGKWHLGGEGYLPVQQGFAINKGGHHRGSPPGGYYSPYKNPKLADGPAGEYLTDRLTDESIQFLKKNVTNPFLLFLSFYTVHTPIQACARHLQKFQDKAAALSVPEYAERLEHNGYTKLLQNDPEYATMVYAMDENVGRLLRALEDLGLDQNTIIFFTSDNGGLSTLGRHWAPTSNEPLRAGKGWCYEGGIRVPLIIRAPGLTRAGSIHDEPVMSMDFFPTMLDLAALPHMPEKHIDGLSLLPLLRGGERLDREALYWHYPHYHGSTWTPGAAIRVREWKLIEFYHYETVELYNLMEDVQESNDLADKLPDVRDQLLQHLHAWQARLGASMPKLNPAFVE